MRRPNIQKFFLSLSILSMLFVFLFLFSACGVSRQNAGERKEENGQKGSEWAEGRQGKQKREAETTEERSASPGNEFYPYLEKLEIGDINKEDAKFEIYMPKGSEVNDGFGFYHRHGLYFTATVNRMAEYEYFEEYIDLKLEYYLGPDLDYMEVYSSGVLENGDDRYCIINAKGRDYDGTPREVRRLDYMEVQPSGDCVNWDLEMNKENADEETDLIIAEIEKCHGIDLAPLKKDSPLEKDTQDQDEYIVEEGEKTLADLDGYRYLGVVDLEDYDGRGVCQAMIPKGYYTTAGDSHTFSFLHGVWMTADVEEFYFGNTLMSELKSSMDLKYETRQGNTEVIRNVWRSAMLPVPGFDNGFYVLLSYEKKGYGTETYFPRTEVLCYMQYDKAHYLALEIFIAGEKCDDAAEDVIQELEMAYGIEMS